MNIATTNPDTVRAVSEAMQLACLLDDRAPKPSPERVLAWAQQIQRHHLGRDDLLDGVQAFYDQPHERAVTIADLIACARRLRRDRFERQDPVPPSMAIEAPAVLAGIANAIGPLRHTTDRLDKARIAMQCATDRATAVHAIREYLDARAEARQAQTPEKAPSVHARPHNPPPRHNHPHHHPNGAHNDDATPAAPQ